MKKSIKKSLLFAPVILIGISTILFIFRGNNYYKAADGTVAVLQSDSNVTVEKGNYITFTPKITTDTGFIFYPGGKVDENAYAPQDNISNISANEQQQIAV